jgi:hypothetical protein
MTPPVRRRRENQSMTELVRGWPCPTCGDLIREGEDAVDALRGDDMAGFGQGEDIVFSVPVKFHPGLFRDEVRGHYYRLAAHEE